MFVNNILINQQSANNNVYTVNDLSVIILDYLTSGQIEGFVSILSQNINFTSFDQEVILPFSNFP